MGCISCQIAQNLSLRTLYCCNHEVPTSFPRGNIPVVREAVPKSPLLTARYHSPVRKKKKKLLFKQYLLEINAHLPQQQKLSLRQNPSLSPQASWGCGPWPSWPWRGTWWSADPWGIFGSGTGTLQVAVPSPGVGPCSGQPLHCWAGAATCLKVGEMCSRICCVVFLGGVFKPGLAGECLCWSLKG